MTLRRMIIVAGALSILAGVIFLFGSTFTGGFFTAEDSPTVPWFVSIGIILSGFGLLMPAGRTGQNTALTRVIGVTLGVLAIAVPAFFFCSHGRALESIVVWSTGLLGVAVSLFVLSWARSKRLCAAVASALAIAVIMVGFGSVLEWLLGIEPNQAVIGGALLPLVLFTLLGAGLFGAAKIRIDQFPANERHPLDLQLPAMTGACVGLLALAGLSILTLMARDSEDVERLINVDRFQTALVNAEARLRDIYALPANPDDENGRLKVAIDEAQISFNELIPFSTSAEYGRRLHELIVHAKKELTRLKSATVSRGEPLNQRVYSIAGSAPYAEISADISRLKTAIDSVTTDRMHANRSRHRLVGPALTATAAVMAALLVGIHLIFNRDISERQRSESALRRHNETLKSFAHTVAHDLRAPLRGISGYAAELDAQASAVDTRGRHCITQIKIAAQNLERLIGDTLDYAQVDAETPRLTTIALPSLVASLLQQRAPEIRLHGTQVATQFGIVTVTSWERGLVQIIGNLLDNALKYSRYAQPPSLRIETAQTPLSWRLVIYDNGIGFDMKYHDRIFGLFQRLVTAEEFEGTGAGLAIVRKITDRLGGTVRAEARPGGGATFLVELPIVPSRQTSLS